MPPELFVPCEQLLESFDSDQFQLLKSFKSDQLQKYTLRVQLRKLGILRKSCDQIWWGFKTEKLFGPKNGKSWTVRGVVEEMSGILSYEEASRGLLLSAMVWLRC